MWSEEAGHGWMHHVKYLLSFRHYKKQGKLWKEISGFYALLIKAAKEFSVSISVSFNEFDWIEMKCLVSRKSSQRNLIYQVEK